MKPYYDEGSVTIYHGDCREVLATISGVGCSITSPPYNTLGSRVPMNADKPNGLMTGNGWIAKVAAHGYADDMSESEYADWQGEVAGALLQATIPGGSFFYNHKVRYRERRAIHPIDLVRSFDGWQMRQEIIWDRRRAMALNARLFAPSDERIYWLVKPGADHKWNQSAMRMSVWTVIPDNDPRGKHPCPYPLGIPARCIAATTDPDDVVLDPFMGSGTTLRAAKDLGRKAIGIEIEERYCEIAAERLGQEVLFGEAA